MTTLSQTVDRILQNESVSRSSKSIQRGSGDISGVHARRVRTRRCGQSLVEGEELSERVLPRQSEFGRLGVRIDVRRNQCFGR